LSGVVVSALASINEVNLHRAQLVLRWATVSGFSSWCRTLISVCNQQIVIVCKHSGDWIHRSTSIGIDSGLRRRSRSLTICFTTRRRTRRTSCRRCKEASTSFKTRRLMKTVSNVCCWPLLYFGDWRLLVSPGVRFYPPKMWPSYPWFCVEDIQSSFLYSLGQFTV